MIENDLTQELVKRFRRKHPYAVTIKHDDMRTAGVPDISVTAFQRTAWLEAKRGEAIESNKVQRLMMHKLYRQGIAAYVLYTDSHTFIVAPVLSEAFTVYLAATPKRNDHDMVIRWTMRRLKHAGA